MKKQVLLLLVLVLFSCGVYVQNTPNNQPDKPLTVIVMDTAQALLNNAEVKVGKTVLYTSFDGRVVLENKQMGGSKKVSVSCDGFVTRKVKRGDSEVLIVILERKRAKKDTSAESGEPDIYYSLGAAKSGVRYEKVAVGTDYAILNTAERELVDLPAIEPYSPMDGGYASMVSAGKLTAGEVNDFAKWYFWSKVIDGSHKAFVGDWNLSPCHRYTAQVMTRSGAPVASRAVSLLDEKGNTLFQAVTDNTGKAELWANLLNDRQPTDHLQVRVDDQILPAKPWSEGLNIFVLDEKCEVSDAVDVVFVFDATGSMGDELRYLQAEMKDVIGRATQATGDLAIRTGAVVYRDHDDDYITRIARLTDDIKTTQAFIDKQVADGGGDYPEAIPEALMAALNSSGWDAEARARIAFLVLDAPCHQDSLTLSLLHEQVLNAAAQGVRIVPVVCSGLKESGEFLLRAMALATNGTSFFLTDDSGIGDTHLKPATDSLKVEHLNDMLVRTIAEFSSMPECAGEAIVDEDLNDSERFIPNPFSAQDLAKDPTIPHGEGVHYLVDVSGKLLGVYQGEVPTDFLATGVYFIKTFVDGQWRTRKILVHSPVILL